MKYNKYKVEAAKILFAEILELNQELPEDRSIDVKFEFGKYPNVEIQFWKQVQEAPRPAFKKEAEYINSLVKENWPVDDETFISCVTAKMQEWKELYRK